MTDLHSVDCSEQAKTMKVYNEKLHSRPTHFKIMWNPTACKRLNYSSNSEDL